MSGDVHVRFCESRGVRFPPATHLVVLADRRWKVEAADRLVRSIVSDIGLEVAEAKSGIVAVRDGFEFLGFQFLGRFLRPRPRSLAAFKRRVKALTPRHTTEPVSSLLVELNPVIRGWGNYQRLGHVAELFDDLDKWIRMRLRSHVLGWKASRYIGVLPNSALRRLGLVSLVDLYRARTSPVPGIGLG